MKTYRVKLNTSLEIDLKLKRLAGAYRKIYNTCMDAQVYKVIYNNDPKNHFITGSKLTKIMKYGSEHGMFPFLKEVDKGILPAATMTAVRAFRFQFKYKPNTVPYLSRKKDNMRFKTNGQLTITEEFVRIPKIGKIPFYEKNRIPLGVAYSNISFTHDGEHWFLNLSIEPSKEHVELSEETVFVDFNNDGNLIVNGTEFENIVKSENFIKEEKKYKKIYKKLIRQTKINSKEHFGRLIPVPTKNIKKTQQKLNKIKIRMTNIKKDNFNKTVNELAILKPKELHLLSNAIIRSDRNNYLSRNQRKSESRTFLSMLQKKLSSLGTIEERHSSVESFLLALGSKVTDCGEFYEYPKKAEAILDEAIIKSSRDEKRYMGHLRST